MQKRRDRHCWVDALGAHTRQATDARDGAGASTFKPALASGHQQWLSGVMLIRFAPPGAGMRQSS